MPSSAALSVFSPASIPSGSRPGVRKSAAGSPSPRRRRRSISPGPPMCRPIARWRCPAPVSVSPNGPDPHNEEELMSTLRQQSIDIEGIAHGAPIPTGSRVGNVLATSAVSGRDAKTGKLAADVDGQARLAFENLKKILEGGGMGLGDVVK